MSAERGDRARRVLLLPPTPRDGEATCGLLASAGVACRVCDTLDQLCAEAAAGAALIVVPEEAVLGDGAGQLARCVEHQPVWSDLPVIVLSRAGVESPAVERALNTLGNVSLIERPTRVSTLLSLVRASLRARERQYQVRDALDERQALSERERAARAEAEAANRAKDAFLAVLSHELRTPLTPVLMTAAELERRPDLPDDVREAVSMVRRNIDLETRLIDDLLDLSRVTSGKLRLRIEQASLHGILRHACEVSAADASVKRLTVTLDLAASDDRVAGDPSRLQQVFWNLIKNAVKFTPEGGEVTVRTADAGPGRVRVEVTDTGIGITREALPRIFDAFEQGDAGAVGHRFGGLGLGLAISRAIMELHGGTITASSRGPGAGATFTVEMDTTAPAAPPVAPPAGRHEDAAADRQPHRILLVEDHPDTARVLGRLLGQLGYHISVAHDVASALTVAAGGPFDLLISDIGLPDATGYDLMRQLRSRYGMRGIALSGYGMDDDVRRGREAGFEVHVTKPVHLPHLQAAIRRVLGQEA